jgi:hypothetical protein
MNRTIKVTRVVYETTFVAVNLTDEQLALMSKNDLEQLASDLATDRDIHQVNDSFEVEVIDGHQIEFTL